MKILITGIDGFLGRRIAAELKAACHEVVGVSNGDPVHGFECRKVNITDSTQVRDVFSNLEPELCIHLAAMAHADVGPDQEWRVRRVNVDGALNVARAAEECGCRDFIYFSTAKVLADTTTAGGVDETDEPRPKGVYPTLKREVEVELLDRSEQGRLRVAVVRPVAVVGPEDTKGNYAKIIAMMRKGGFPLLDRGRARRSIVFLDRVAARVATMVEKGVRAGGVYTFADADFELREIVDAIRVAVGFAWCPEMSVEMLTKVAPFIDEGFRRFGYKRAPAENVLKRLTGSFVVRTHRFAEDYGELAPVDLRQEIATVCR